jgi:anthranilate synthase component I
MPLMITTLLSDLETPVSVYEKLSRLQPGQASFLLESAEGDSKIARFSLVGVCPLVTASMHNHVATLTHRNGQTEHKPFSNPWQVLQDEPTHQQIAVAGQALTALTHLPFLGGWVGYLGYGATQYFDHIPQQQADPFSVPDGFWGLYDTFVVFDHLYRQMMVISLTDDVLHQQVLDALKQPSRLQPLSLPTLTDDQVFNGVSQGFSREAFCDLVLQAQQAVRLGQVFQIVPSHRFSLPVKADPLTMYRVVQAINPSPYGYYLQMPGFCYVGSSPETFLTCRVSDCALHQALPDKQAEKTVILRALAGTRPRGKTPAEDSALHDSLKSDPKELAEHAMLVDLGRNDLGRVCQVGSINVGEVGRVVFYTHVMHLSTELQGVLKPDKTAYDMAQSCFPRGTLTGAPKIRAMQLLSELESERRGIYAGMVGYFDWRGSMDSAIAIRSVLVKAGTAHVNAGAGVVYDSQPDSEYEETRNKARSMLKAIQLAERLATPVKDAD